ncbi:hypothetical protein L226DRAFT_527749, partial [Lentinus tigrinus ALCF2SS1-7]|uniref:uncharacterized protein n=1 Tax=Lentinus tigrinus ALCF2SS1-7 TaxID=1328758 RepID=UPI00116630D0
IGPKIQVVAPHLPPAALLPGNPILSPQLASRRPRSVSTAFTLNPQSAPTPTSLHSTPLSAPGAAFVQPQQKSLALHQVRAERLGPLVAQVKEALNLFAGLCPVCRVSNPRGHPQAVHPRGVLNCPVMGDLQRQMTNQADRVCGTYLDWMKQRVKYTEKGGCAGRGNFSCEERHQDVIASVVYWAFFTRSERIAAEVHFEQTWVDDGMYALWLVKTERGENFTNMIHRLKAGQQ